MWLEDFENCNDVTLMLESFEFQTKKCNFSPTVLGEQVEVLESMLGSFGLW